MRYDFVVVHATNNVNINRPKMKSDVEVYIDEGKIYLQTLLKRHRNRSRNQCIISNDYCIAQELPSSCLTVEMKRSLARYLQDYGARMGPFSVHQSRCRLKAVVEFFVPSIFNGIRTCRHRHLASDRATRYVAAENDGDDGARRAASAAAANALQ